HLRLGSRLAGPEPSDSGADPSQRPQEPGSVPCRFHPPVRRVPDRDRHADLRSSPRRARSAHPPGRRTMNTAGKGKRHYVGPAPFDPGATEPVGAGNETFYRASSWRLMWWKCRRHRVAVAAAFILLAFYLMVPLVEVIAPYNQTS